MTAQSAEGVILRKYFLRETSYILVFFTKEYGKIKGVIKGVRNPYPQYAGDYEIFSLCRLMFYRKKKSPMDLITQCEAFETFLAIRKDIERLTYASYFIELIDIVTGDYDPNEEIYNILLTALNMTAGTSSAKRISRIFELKLMGALGMSPEMHSCAGCGKELEGETSFSVKSGGLLCGKCRRGDPSCMKVSLGTVNFIRKIQESDMARTAGIKVSREVGRETEEVLKRFLKYHINRPVKSLGFLGELHKIGVV